MRNSSMRGLFTLGLHGVAMETRRDTVGNRGVRQHVPGELGDGELVERHVVGVGIDHPVTKEPYLPQAICRVATGVGVPGLIEPILSSALREGRRSEKLVDDFFRCRRRSVGKERIQFLGSRWQAAQIETQTPEPRTWFRWRRWIEIRSKKTCENKAIYGMATSLFRLWQSRANEALKRPMLVGVTSKRRRERHTDRSDK